MEIIQLHLKHFGKFTDYRLDLHAGINIISGGNETGKSTLHAFIRAMFYGITRTRSKSLDEYQLREPWENPSYFAGSMKILYDGKIYRIDRNFHRRDESLEVVCETDGTQAEDPEQAIRAFVGNLSESDFDNTIFIRQTQNAAGAQLGERLRDYLVNMEHSADASVDVSAAMDSLKKRRKKIENEKSAALTKIEEEIREKTREAEYLNQDLERLLERRSRDSADHIGASSFERIGGRENDVLHAGASADGVFGMDEAAGVDGTAAANGIGTAGGTAAVNGTAAADGTASANGTAVANESANVGETTDTNGTVAAGGTAVAQDPAAGDPQSVRSPSSKRTRKGILPELEGDDDEEDMEPIQIPDEDDEPGGALLSVSVLLAFATAILMCVCAVLVEHSILRFVLGAGTVVMLIVAFSLLWRVMHPLSKAQKVQKKLKRTDFFDRHLGFREDLSDPDDRAEYLRRQEEAREQIRKAKEEDEREAALREERRMEQIDKALQARQEEDMNRRGREVARIARSEVIDREISLRREKLDVLEEELEKLYQKKAELGRYDTEVRAIELAQHRIRELSGNIYHESGADFAEDVSVLLAGLTEGRYTRISLDEKMLVRLNTPDRLLSIDQVSCGTMHQVYFALRLASAGLLSDNAQIPVILDEPFAMYDEERLESALRFLAGCGRQVILFSCQRRELDLLSKIRRA